MQLQFTYNKKQVIQALRLHFISKKEIKLMMIVVNIYAILSAILFYTKKIRPEPFVMGSFIWLMLMIAIWYILPYTIYKKSATFKDRFTIFFYNEEIRLDNGQGIAIWKWAKFNKYFESTYFFHLYFDSKSFFLIPKDNLTTEKQNEIKKLLQEKIHQ